MTQKLSKIIAILSSGLLVSQAIYAQSEEKTFKSGVASTSRSDACFSAKEAAQAWLRENTDKSHSYFLMNQAKRGWVAKSEGSSSCDCAREDTKYVCTVDARISAVR